MSKYLFGDLVREVKEKVDRQNNPYEFFIAGDHMDTDELHLLRRGTFAGSDVGPAFIRIFKPGQVLYGSRRTYLRKVAVADFEGVTANTTFVLETKDESILHQRLLPFIMQSERFVQHSIKRSKGSTNPYVLFSDLCDYEVDLPDIETQKRLAEILWAIDEVKMAYKRLIAATDELVKSQFIEWFGSGNPGNRMTTVEECCASINGGGTPSMSHPEYYGGDIPFIKSGDVKFDYVSKGALWLTSDAIEKTTARLLPAGTVLVVVRSAALKNEFHVAIAENPLVINQDLKALQPKDGIVPEYLMWAIKSREHEILQKVQTMLTSHIEIRDILNLPVKRASTEEQAAWKAFVRQSDKSKFELEQALSELPASYKRIITEQLG